MLHDPTVSAHHAEIIAGVPGYSIRDLQSTNGVFVGSVRIERAPLVDGMRVRIGDSTISVASLGRRESVQLARSGTFNGLVTHSVKMRALASMVEQAAATDATVLIEGQTGSGKEVVAQALHEASPRANGPFIVFDCSTAATALAGAELFGHERGAFSGADQPRAGLLEEAEGGTLFLDEIGELPLSVQPILLGALERRASRRIGGRNLIEHDVRIIAATHRNLAEEVRQGRMREDLFFRLAVVRLRVPPLRERPEDIPVLAQQFAAELGAALSPEVVACFANYDWPGNVRELRNTVMRAAALPNASLPGWHSETGHIAHRPLVPLQEARRLAIDEFEAKYLEQALEASGGNVTHAATAAGISRRAFSALLAKHNLRNRDRED